LVEEVLVGCLQFLLYSVDSLIEVVHEVLLVLVGVIVGTEASRVILLTLLEVDYFLFKLLNLVLVLFNDLLTEMRSLRQFLLHLLMVC
jgi:hypothetical protein